MNPAEDLRSEAVAVPSAAYRARLLAMLERVCANCRAEPDPVATVLEHLRRFWHPWLRQALTALDAQERAQASETARQVLERLDAG